MYIYKLLMLLLCIVCVSCAQGKVYRIESIQGRVVDAETEEPLEGVVVVAFYAVEYGGFAGTNLVGYLDPVEAVTNSDGKYRMPALGDIDSTDNGGYVAKYAPELYFYKFGYAVEKLENDYRKHDWKDDRRYSEWDSKRIELKRFEGTEKQYAENIFWFSRRIDDATPGPTRCGLVLVPNALRELNRTKNEFNNSASYNTVISPVYPPYDDLKGCQGYERFTDVYYSKN